MSSLRERLETLANTLSGFGRPVNMRTDPDDIRTALSLLEKAREQSTHRVVGKRMRDAKHDPDCLRCRLDKELGT